MQRYDNPGRYYRFLSALGRAELADLKAPYERRLSAIEQSSNSAGVMRDAALFHMLEGDPAKACELMRKSIQLDKDVFSSALIASLYFELNQPDNARAAIEAALKEPELTPRDHAFRVCMSEMLRCSGDPDAVPSREGEVGKLAAMMEQMAAARGNACYLLGRVAERSHHEQDAIWWYQAALDAAYEDFTCRAAAAVALRKMGKEYYN